LLIKALGKDIDDDGNGMITFDEFVHLMQKNLIE